MWEPPKFQNGFKTALSSIDRRLNPPKIISRKGSRKNMKNQSEIHRTIIDFGMLKPSKTMPSAMNSRLSVFLKMLKKYASRDPKSHSFGYKTDHWALKGRFIECFGLIWGDVARGVKKSIKIDPSGTKGRKGTKDPSPRGELRRRKRPREGVVGGKSLPRVSEEGLKAECS